MADSNQGLRYQGLMPLAIHVIPALPGSAQLSVINSNNESMLKASLLLHDIPEIDEHDPVSLELKRQDLKIDLLLNMVGELLASKVNIPSEKRLAFTASSLTCDKFEEAEHIVQGNLVKVSIYISSLTPKPLILFGTIEKAESLGELLVSFSGINQTIQDYLEKFIFRQHRREIAQRKLIQ